MNKWNDGDDQIDLIFININRIKNLPCICPLCGTKNGHVYLHRWKTTDARGGMWVWCSLCKHSSHGIVHVPEWWENNSEIEFGRLTSHPHYLEEHKDIVDYHFERLAAKRDNIT